ncbi:hypothetical protein ZEAMMB73_Zm00001d021312, partial [Zea mays]
MNHKNRLELNVSKVLCKLRRLEIFQHPLSDKVPKTVPSCAVSLIEPPVASVKRIRTDKRTGDTSAIALAVHFSTCCRGLARVG